MEKRRANFWTIAIIILLIYFGAKLINSITDSIKKSLINEHGNYTYSDSTFSLITTPENKVLEDTIVKFAKKKGFDLVVGARTGKYYKCIGRKR